MHKLIRVVRRTPYLGGLLRRLRLLPETIRLVTKPQKSMRYHVKAPQKSTLQMAIDNLLWTLRRGEVNDGYYLLGLDSTEGPEVSRLHSHSHRMSVISDQIRARGAGNLASLLKDKYLFALVAQALDYPSPRNLALLDPGGATLLSPRKSIAYESLPEQGKGIDGFCKPMRGQHGDGCFLLSVRDGRIFMNESEVAPDALRAHIKGRHLVQERLEQHAAMATLYPHSINSVRLITAHVDGEVFPFEAVLRMGVQGSVVDNWSAGGLIVLVDLETGRLRGRGFHKPGTRSANSETSTAVTHHPDTGVPLDGYRLPPLEEAVDLACRFHRDLGEIVTIAWDLAITPTGPVIIEGNTHWDGRVQMALDPSFEVRYRRLIERA